MAGQGLQNAVRAGAKLAVAAARFAATGDPTALAIEGANFAAKAIKVLCIAIALLLAGIILISYLLLVSMGNVVSSLWSVFQPENAAAQAEAAAKDRANYDYNVKISGHMSTADQDELSMASINENFNSTYRDYAMVVQKNLQRGRTAARTKYERKKDAARAAAAIQPHENPGFLYSQDGVHFYKGRPSLPYTKSNPTETKLTQADANALVTSLEAYNTKRMEGIVFDESGSTFDDTKANYKKGIIQIIAAYTTMKAETTKPSVDKHGNFFTWVSSAWNNVRHTYSTINDFKMIFDDQEVLEDMFHYSDFQKNTPVTASIPLFHTVVRNGPPAQKSRQELVRDEHGNIQYRPNGDEIYRTVYYTVPTYYYETVLKGYKRYTYTETSYSAALGEFDTNKLLERLFVRFGGDLWNQNTIQYTKAAGNGLAAGGDEQADVFEIRKDAALSGDPWTHLKQSDPYWFIHGRLEELYGICPAKKQNDLPEALLKEHPDLFKESALPAVGALFVGTSPLHDSPILGIVRSSLADSLTIEQPDSSYAGFHSWKELKINRPNASQCGLGILSTKVSSFSALFGGKVRYIVPTAKGLALLKERQSSIQAYTDNPNAQQTAVVLAAAGKLADLGLSVNAIAAIMGNINQESSYTPTAGLNGPGAFGLVQWTGKKTTAINWLRDNGGVEKPAAQMEFLIKHDIEAGNWMRRLDHPQCPQLSWADFKTSNLPAEELALVFCAYFERCAPWEIMPERRQSAAAYWQKYFTDNGLAGSLKAEDIILVGDSRFEGIRQDARPKGAVIAKVGAGLNDLKNNLMPRLNSKISSLSRQKGCGVVFGLGVNDIGGSLDALAGSYAAVYNQFAKDHPDIKVFVSSVNPIQRERNTSYASIRSGSLSNSKIQGFNTKLKEKLDSKITWINTYEYLASQSYQTSDGLHYTPEWNKKIYDNLMEQLAPPSAVIGANGQLAKWRKAAASDFDAQHKLQTILGAPYWPRVTKYEYNCEHPSDTNVNQCPRCPTPTSANGYKGQIKLRQNNSGLLQNMIMKLFNNLTPLYDFSQRTPRPKEDIEATDQDKLDIFPDEDVSQFKEAVNPAPDGAAAGGEMKRWGPSHIYTVQDQINFYIDDMYQGVDGKDVSGFEGGAKSLEGGVANAESLHVNLLSGSTGSLTAAGGVLRPGVYTNEYRITADSAGNVTSLEWENPADYCQWDNGYRPNSEWGGSWGGTMAGSATIGAGGCVYTSLSNIMATLSGRPVDVQAVCVKAGQQGRLNAGFLGATNDAVAASAREYGYQAELVSPNFESIKKVLLEGRCVIFFEGASPWYGGGGHAITGYGFKDGKVFICDPNNPSGKISVSTCWVDLNYVLSYHQPIQAVVVGEATSAKKVEEMKKK